MTLTMATRAMIPGRGRIVNVIADIFRGFPGMVHTGAARAGVDNMTKTLAVEWASFGIRVDACAPGVIRSSGTEQYGEGRSSVHAGRFRSSGWERSRRPAASSCFSRAIKTTS